MKSLLLLILDGFGIAEPSSGNAISQANLPHFENLWNNFPHTQLTASGEVVGLPNGQMGNSEVGHLSIGAGRTVKQSLAEINDVIDGHKLADQPALAQALLRLAASGHRLHLVGLVSDGGVHSDLNHLTSLITAAQDAGITEIFIHAITDGRDTDPKSGLDFIQELDLFLLQHQIGKIATVSGRYYAMDRDQRWERTGLAYQAMVEAKGESFKTAERAIECAYRDGVTDEFIKPCVIHPEGKIQTGDSVLCFNFRPDRMIQLCQSLTEADFDHFERPTLAIDLLTMTNYQPNLKASVIFPKQTVKQTLGEILSTNQIRQHRIAETEKYAHVTYFLNGGQHQPFPDEKRTLIESPKVATYDLRPEMSAHAITDAILEDIKQHTSQVIVANFANPDMVGHTGNLAATITALEVVDQQLGRIIKAADEANDTLIITADHGNAEAMQSASGDVLTAHSTAPVPFIINQPDVSLRNDGSLIDIAPTILQLLSIKQPKAMTGRSLIK